MKKGLSYIFYLVTMELSMWLCLTSIAEATEYVFTAIAPPAHSAGLHIGIPAINNKGKVAFFQFPTSIRVGDGISTLIVADNTNGFLGFGERPLSPDISINDNDTVAFSVAFGGAGPNGLGYYITNGVAVTFIATVSNGMGTRPDFLIADTFVTYFSSINDRGMVAFSAFENIGPPGGPNVGGEGGVFIWDGTMIETLVDTSGPLDKIPTFGLGPPHLNNKGEAAFQARLDAGGQGVFVSDGTITRTIADSTGSFSSFSLFPVLNDHGLAAFAASLDTGEEGIFTGDGSTVTTIVDTSGPFSEFRRLAINRNGTVVFLGSLDSGGRGIFTGPNPVADKVIRIGDTLSGLGVADLDFGRDGFNDLGQIAFGALLFDGSTGIYRADPIIELTINIKPGDSIGSINPKSKGNIPVAILSTVDFNAPARTDVATLTFGRTGDEPSLDFCNKGSKDINGDGLPDLVCHFATSQSGFQSGDTEGIVKGKTFEGLPLRGRDLVQVVPF